MNITKRVLSAVIAVTAVVSASILSETPETVTEIPGKNGYTKGINAEEIGYTVKSLDGKIAVFRDNYDEPEYTLDSPFVRDLPEYDRKLLENGIPADSEEEVKKILEDLGS